MKTLQIFTLGLFLGLAPACGQQKNNGVLSPGIQNELLPLKDSLGKPDYKAQVNKHYDKDGRLTHYDSTYTYSWHSGNGLLPRVSDSLFLSFFNDPLFPEGSDPFSVFMADSTFMNNGAFHSGFFQRHMEANRRLMERFFKPDSLMYAPPRRWQ
jgi:hypothetical protein